MFYGEVNPTQKFTFDKPPTFKNIDSNNKLPDYTIKTGDIGKFNANKCEGIEVEDENKNEVTFESYEPQSSTTNPLPAKDITKPTAGTNKTFDIAYKAFDKFGQTSNVMATRSVTVTNQIPTFSGISDMTIKEGESINFLDGVTAYDNEDKDITSKITLSNQDIHLLSAGKHQITYTVTDSDGNAVKQKRNVTIKTKPTPPPVNPPTPPPVNPPTDSDNNNGGSDNENNNGENNNTPVAPPIVDGGTTPTTPPSDNNGGNTENLPATQENDKNNNQVADSQNKEESNNYSNNNNDTIICADNTGDFSHSGEKTPGTNTNSITNGFISWWWLILMVIAFIAYKIYKKYKDDKELDMDIEA